MKNVSRREMLVGSLATAALPILSQRIAAAEPPVVLDDASRLNATPVARHLVLRPDDEARLLASLRQELAEAHASGRPFSASAARHSMGGQSLPRMGTAITFEGGRCEIDRTARTARVPAGLRWHEVIAALDPAGFSPKVMQSNNDFGVASTFSVNAHGWPVPFGPFGATVRALRLMLADGTLIRCSREENAELFVNAMGGYGLFGVIIDLEMEIVENRLLDPTFESMPAEAFAKAFVHAAENDREVCMAYGRLNVSLDDFFEEALMVTYRPVPTPEEGLPSAGTGGFMSAVSREIFRAQVGSDRAKKARWFAERRVGPRLGGSAVTRNTLLNEPVSNLASEDTSRTDILHEYFVPPARFEDFLDACRGSIPGSYQDMLNVTLRYVAADRESVLAYAPEPRIGAVMLFSQEMTPRAEADMRRMTSELIGKVIALGGSFYLPYRLHASRDQVRAGYPRLDEFLAAKRRFDPKLTFRNRMWDTYFSD